MYFEEAWFLVFYSRLNKSGRMSSAVTEEDEFEEGEIVDDEETETVSAAPPAAKGGWSSYPHRPGPPPPRPRPQPDPPSSKPAYVSRNSTATPPRWSRRRQSYKRGLSPRVPPRLPNSNNRRPVNNGRRNIREETLYEDKLKEFQMRRRRNGSKPEERRTTRTVVSGLVQNNTSLLKRLVGSGSTGIRVLEDSVPEACSPHTRDVKSEDSPVDCSQRLVSETEDSKKSFREEALSSRVVDDELNLRMEALKTVVLKKHEERLRRGYVPKKISSKSTDTDQDSFMEEVVSLNYFLESEGADKTDCLNVDSDMSLDSNYVSDEESFKRDRRATADGFNESSAGTKRTRSEERESPPKIRKVDDASDLNLEELELRAIALESVYRRASKNPDLTKETKVETQEPVATNCGTDAPRERRVSENWEELDEDILRAQLLETLSASLPETRTVRQSPSVQSLVKTGSLPSKKDSDPELELKSRLWSQKMVPKLVIDRASDSESDLEAPRNDFIKSLDLLLRVAKQKSESNPVPDIKPKQVRKKNSSPKQLSKRPPVVKRGPFTPVVVKHLPITKQEEYRKLQLRLAEKMKLKSLSKVPKNSLTKAVAAPGPTSSQRFDLPRTCPPSKVDPHRKTNSNRTESQVGSSRPSLSFRQNTRSKAVKNLKSVAKADSTVVNKTTDNRSDKTWTRVSAADKVKTDKTANVSDNAVKSETKNNKLATDDDLVVEKPCGLADKKTASKCSGDYKADEDEGAVDKDGSGAKSAVASMKENEWSSDKENDGVGSRINCSSVSDPKDFDSDSVGDGSGDGKLSEMLRKAEAECRESEALVDRLKGELDLAQRRLSSRRDRVAALKRRLAPPLLQPTSATAVLVKDAKMEVTGADEGSCCPLQPESNLKTPDSECCWDPDGVLCPYQLAGSCKDPLCSFNHIRS